MKFNFGIMIVIIFIRLMEARFNRNLEHLIYKDDIYFLILISYSNYKASI